MYVETIGGFYAKWLEFNPPLRSIKENEWGYKKRAVRLIAQLLEIKECAVWHWGDTLNAKVPPLHQPKLSLLLLQKEVEYQRQTIEQRNLVIRCLEAQITRLTA